MVTFKLTFYVKLDVTPFDLMQRKGVTFALVQASIEMRDVQLQG